MRFVRQSEIQKTMTQIVIKWKYLIVGVVLVAIDQTSKWWVTNHPFFVVKNSGIIFGMGSGWGIFVLISICLILGLFLFTIERPEKIMWPIVLIFSGAISNIIDRIARGGIIDFIKVKGDLAFNLADIMVILGVALYIIIFFKNEGKVFRHK